MEFFKTYLPDCNHYLVSKPFGKIEELALWPDQNQTRDIETIAVRIGNSISIVPVSDARIQAVYFEGINSQEKILVYDPQAGQFIPLTDVQEVDAQSVYAQGLDLFLDNERILTRPDKFEQKLSSLVDASRKIGIMIPSTAYIIVERSSQWKTLRLKQNQRLRSSEGLEFEEGLDTPAPPLWVLIFCLIVYVWMRNRIPSIERNSKFSPAS